MLKLSRFYPLALMFLLHSLIMPHADAQMGRVYAQDVAPKPETTENIESPRYMFRQFLNIMKREDVPAAVNFIEFPKRWGSDRRQRTAEQLIDVLNKRGRVNLAELSIEADGFVNDNQPPDIEIIGQVIVNGDATPITLVRVVEGEQKYWRFAPEFIDQIQGMAEKIQQSDIEANIPPILVKHQFRGIKVWQWLGLFLGIVVAALIARILTLVLIKSFNLISRRFTIDLTAEMMRGFVPPLRMLTGLGVFHLAMDSLDLNLAIRQTVQYGLTVIFTLALIFLALRLTEVGIAMMRLSFERQGRPGSAAMLPPTQKGLKTIIVVIGIIFLLRDLGFNVTAIVAGLGVGGLAIALAGQKTIENLFGGVSVTLDQPVRVGDFGRFGDIVGTVEDIGLRSTRVRTLDRTIVSIPNAEFSHMKLENFEKRDKLRWTTTMILRFDTSANQLRFILIKLKEMLIGHPMVMNDPARVRFTRFVPYGFEIEFFAYIRSTDWNEYLAVIEDLNIRIIFLIEEAGAGFGFQGAPMMLMPDEATLRERRAVVDEKIKQMEALGGFPLPLYPQEWIEPRTDLLEFGAVKKDTDLASG
ncbi:MAG TPA: mechanosensitive ion channel domain-containing protein [Oligoflexus sp.]|uniref:mechanosensitive ion channel family protein n=1 Tax=Oligoflexus sp. TaxID=1971216 RepID=UPI002D7E5A64|nr:mechanosensitive ion channel domain-containing protein [Oligoflexus sp.]HET9241234.1 mechanosensitive ion channel domain-containing protein [Oligoflexus sp.]